MHDPWDKNAMSLVHNEQKPIIIERIGNTITICKKPVGCKGASREGHVW